MIYAAVIWSIKAQNVDSEIWNNEAWEVLNIMKILWVNLFLIQKNYLVM